MTFSKVRALFVVYCLATIFLLNVDAFELYAQTARNVEQLTMASKFPSAPDVLRASIKALANLSAVEYEVQMNEDRSFYTSKVPKVRAKTKLIVANSPLRVVGKLEGEDGKVHETFVLNDKIMRYSAMGNIGESDISKGFKPLASYGDLRNTWELFLDRGYFAKAIEEGRILYAGQDSIDDDLCDVIIHVTSVPSKNIIVTNYYWISTTSNLPRAKQTLLSNQGQSSLNPRRVLKITKINPKLEPSVFAYVPTENDSVMPASPSVAESSVKNPTDITDRALPEWTGKQLPPVIVENASRQNIKIADVINKPTLITFWATWCLPCLKEMPTFQKMVDKYQSKFQVLAVSTDDDRNISQEFVKKHPEYKFVFLTDPDWQRESSRMKTQLGISALPTNLLVDSKGNIISAWQGERKETEWMRLIDKLITK